MGCDDYLALPQAVCGQFSIVRACALASTWASPAHNFNSKTRRVYTLLVNFSRGLWPWRLKPTHSSLLTIFNPDAMGWCNTLGWFGLWSWKIAVGWTDCMLWSEMHHTGWSGRLRALWLRKTVALHAFLYVYWAAYSNHFPSRSLSEWVSSYGITWYVHLWNVTYQHVTAIQCKHNH